MARCRVVPDLPAGFRTCVAAPRRFDPEPARAAGADGFPLFPRFAGAGFPVFPRFAAGRFAEAARLAELLPVAPRRPARPEPPVRRSGGRGCFDTT